MKSKVFIGSSTENLGLAYSIQENLGDGAEITVWDQGVFYLSESSLDSLIHALDSFDFSIFILSSNDIARIRDNEKSIVRDNVIFELGLFIGHLGKGRTFLVVPKDQKDLHLPTDLIGVNPATFTLNREDHNLQASLGPACHQIMQTIIKIGPFKERSESKDKETINQVWSTLISRSTESVRIFAGDISWATRDENLISNKIKDGIEFYILCERPKKEGKIKENVLKLINIGAKVKYYGEGYGTRLRGLVIDSDDPHQGMGMRITKSCKRTINEIEGEPGNPDFYDYRAIHYLPHNDFHNIEILHQYFDSLFRISPSSILIKTTSISIKNIIDTLRKVKQYETIKEEDVCFDIVTLNEILACCKYVKYNKLESIKHFFSVGETQGISPFETCISISSQGQKLILPPILELSDDKKIVIDGMHRLFLHLVINKGSSAICLLIKTKINLPSIPVPFNEVKITPYKMARHISFENYNPDNFRNIKILEELSKGQLV